MKGEVEKKDRKVLLHFLWGILKPYKWWYLLMAQAPFFSAVYIFASNYSFKLLIDAFSEEEVVGYSHLTYPVLLFIAAHVGLDLSYRISNIAEWKAEPFARQNLLVKTYDYIQFHSYSYFQNIHSGVIISKIKGILEGFDYIFFLHHTLGKNICVITVSIFVLLIVNTYVFLFILIWSVLLVLILYPMGARFNKIAIEYAESKHRILGLVSDNITNIFSIFHFGKRKDELRRIRASMSEDCVPKHVAFEKYQFKFCVVSGILYWLMLFTVFIFMTYLRKKSSITTGDLIFVLLTTLMIIHNLMEFITGLCDFVKRISDLNTSLSILKIPNQLNDSFLLEKFKIIHGKIEFKDTEFSYENSPAERIFSGLNLTIMPGEKVGIVGHSGAGKSTLVSLLLKNFEVSSGKILIDSGDISKMNSDDLRKQISLIPQDIILFHRTIRENIGFSKQRATLDEIKSAAKMANIDAFIESLPMKYDTVVGERGIKISGGQRQRIAIARAILKDAPIVILDEATASLDSITEQQIQQSINLMLEKTNATIIAIAHRLSTIRHMDRIIVLENGKILEDDTFDRLMEKKSGYFRTLWDSQVNGMII